jgi:uncharacterized phage-associated protein
MPFPGFSEQKVTEAVCYLLHLAGGKMYYLKLLKLLYFADRLAFAEWERPITYDSYVSMDHGPVLSTTFDLIRDRADISGDFWRAHITEKNYQVALIGEAPKIKKLSPAEIDVLNRVYRQYGNFDRFELARISHKLPEYKEPHGSSLPITYRDILAALGNSQKEIERIDSELRDEASIDALFGD